MPLPRVARLLAWISVAAATCQPARAAAPSAAPAIELVESVPVESELGNPELRSAHDVWMEMIRGAKDRIDFEEFYLSDWPGEALGDVIDAIGEAAKRGVQVRILLDARFHSTYPQPADSLASLPNVWVRTLDMSKRGGVQHSKFFVVDCCEVYIGSQNLDWRALKHIHELGVRLGDISHAVFMGNVFEGDWKVATPVAEDPQPYRKITYESLGIAPSRIVQAPGDTAVVWPSVNPQQDANSLVTWDRDAIVRTIDRARRDIAIQLLTYGVESRGVRDTTIDAALRRAANRGVKVRMIISDWEPDNAKRMADLQRLARVPNVEAKLSTVPDWSGGYIPFARVEHCKYMVVDGKWLWLGTSNWEPDYFHNSRNVAVTIENARLAGQAQRIFETSWTAPGAKPIDPDRRYTPKIHGQTPPPGARKYGN